ncbi:MAG: type VI secretion system tip protein VgrG [Nannocystis sp.]|nr:type VI secretion system tip protein TssI/VgrG [Nannocystis sp.]MBA3545557.1 type VI secretion system tip protein VgrG [Nannocystis sp.]
MPPDAVSPRALLPEVEYTLTVRDQPLAWQVRRVELREALSTPYTLRIELLCEDPEQDPDALLGADARLTLARTDEHRRDIVGLILRVEQLGRLGDRRSLRLEIGPALALSAHRVDTRAWQRQSALQIVQAVLGDMLAALGRRLRLDLDPGACPPREYCVQYRESDLDLVRRLLHEEGIAFRFEHTGDAETLVLFDTRERCPELGTFPLVPRAAPIAAAEAVEHLTRARALGPTGVTQRDWVALLAADAPFTHAHDTSDERGRHRIRFEHEDRRIDADDGGRRARHKLERHAVARQRCVGGGDVLCFAPGHRFTLGDAPTADYLLLSVEHHGDITTAPNYFNEFVCIPAGLPFRPALDEPARRPRVHGPHTAIVVGPEGEEIHTDEHGRIKVRFHWDSQQSFDEHGSCWIPIAQTWAGAGWGALFIPRVGMEVVVQFLDGDPDRPLVVGCVYNSLSTPPVDLPEHKTCSALVSESSPGGGLANQIRLEDARGRESLTVKSRRNLHTTAGHDHTATVANDHTVEIGQDHTTFVGGSSRLTVAAGDLTTMVGSGDLTTTVLNGHHTTTVHAGTHTTTACGTVKLRSTEADLELTARHGVQVDAAGSDLLLTAKAQIYLCSNTSKISASAQEDISLTSHAGSVALWSHSDAIIDSASSSLFLSAKKNISMGTPDAIEISGDDAITLKSKKLVLCAEDTLELRVGGTSITLTAGSIALEAPAITSKAIGEHIIAGALIRLN